MTDTWTKIKVKAPYVCSRTGAVLHKTDPASDRNWVHWPRRWDGSGRSPEYQVKLKCRYPSIISRAILLDTIDPAPPGRSYYESLKPLILCPHCFTEAERKQL